MLDKEFKYFVDHHDELYKEFPNRCLVIKDEQVVGDFASLEDAIADATKKYELGTFLIQQCTGDSQSYTQTFHSRVVFV